MNEEELKRQIINVKTSVALIEWTADQYAAFLENTGVMSANKIEKCMVYIYDYACESTGDNGLAVKTESEIGADKTTFDHRIVDALASLNNDFTVDPNDIAKRVSKFTLDEINIPAFEIAFLWLEQLVTKTIIEIISSELGHEISISDDDIDIESGKFVLGYLRITSDFDNLNDYYTVDQLASLMKFKVSDTKQGSAINFSKQTFDQRNIFKKSKKKSKNNNAKNKD